MGVADRAYMRRTGPPPIFIGSSWTLRLVILLVVAFAATKGAAGWFRWRGEGAFELSRAAIEDGRYWTLLTSAFLFPSAWPLAFSAIGLWYFGKLAEETLGGARYLAFFLLAILVSHGTFLAAQYATGSHGFTTTGPSGAIIAMLVLAAFRYPGLPVRFWFLPLVLWQLAAAYVAIDLLSVLTRTGSAHEFASLGGAVFGFLVHRFGLLPNFRLPRRAAAPREPGPFAAGNTRAEIDRLLDKINTQGIGSLSESEREFLKRNSGRYG